jgi:hypothetical protein
MPTGYFDRTPKITSHGAMMETLKARTAARSSTAKLSWNKPVRNADDTGHQTAACTDYEIRKTLTKGVVCYWAWHARKLLGFSADVEIARNHCEAHALSTRDQRNATGE